ncbi:uncharacterized protein BYT42DRAFT_647392 [Radiomyces spectabilis]|uniref:uncharacterized protein n=1 Tax=Radiomyces spectabilis TaxID=64574 RepID=UPI00221F08B2|nr:uncharacterized protein BYT42DRAFT_647392 [Radiomyces spectabilis]KAI8371584.1 hypothetical protein BYT42DRAFT_647392 [Radiomyces spectabilis]
MNNTRSLYPPFSFCYPFLCKSCPSPQAINDITAAVVQPAGPFAAESPAVFILPQDDIARFVKEQEERKVNRKHLQVTNTSCSYCCTFVHKSYSAPGALFFASIIPVTVLVATTPPRRSAASSLPSVKCQARISISSFGADRDFVKVTYHWKHVCHFFQAIWRT